MVEINLRLSKEFLKKLSKELLEAHTLEAHLLSEDTILDGLKDYFGNSDFSDRIKSYFIDAIEPDELIPYCEQELDGFDMNVNYPNP